MLDPQPTMAICLLPDRGFDFSGEIAGKIAELVRRIRRTSVPWKGGGK